MKTKVTKSKQAIKITSRLEEKLKEVTKCFGEEFIIHTDNCDTFFTTTIRSNEHWIMSRVVLERITKVAENFCKRYEGMLWGIECSEYTSKATGSTFPTPQLYIQLSINQ